MPMMVHVMMADQTRNTVCAIAEQIVPIVVRAKFLITIAWMEVALLVVRPVAQVPEEDFLSKLLRLGVVPLLIKNRTFTYVVMVVLPWVQLN